MRDLAAELGLPLDMLYRWCRNAPGFRPVQVLADSASTLTVHGPCGLRIEGLNLGSLADLLRRLS